MEISYNPKESRIRMNTNLLQMISENQALKPLQNQLKVAQKSKELLRIVAVLLAQILDVRVVSKLLAMGESTLYKYLGRFKVSPDRFYKESYRPGAPNRTQGISAEILCCVKLKPQDKGYHKTRWTCGLLEYHLESHFGWSPSREHIRQILRQLGYRWKRPKHGPAQCPDPQAEAKLARIEEVKNNLKTGEHLIYSDEADFNLLSAIRSSWSPKGVQVVVPTPGRNQKIYAIGAYEAETRKLVYKVCYRKRAKEFVEFLYQVLMSWSGKIYMVVDNWCVHFSKRVIDFCERYKDKIEFLPLPTYSPQHNKIERLWGIAKDWTNCNYTCKDMTELERAAKTGLGMVQRHLKGMKVV